MKVEEPALALNAIEGRVPLDGLADAGDGAHDERVEAAPDGSFPARHGRDVRLHGAVAVRLCDLRVAAREEPRRRLTCPCSHFQSRLLRGLKGMLTSSISSKASVSWNC